MRRTTTALSFFALSVVIALSAQSSTPEVKPPSPQKVAVIKDLLSLTGSANLGNQVMAQLITSLKPAFPDVPNEVWDRFAKKMHAEEMVDSIIVVYDRHFSLEDVQAAVTFYRTPSGQRLIKELPAVMSEGMAIGQEWGKRKGAELVEELRVEQAAASKGDEH